MAERRTRQRLQARCDGSLALSRAVANRDSKLGRKNGSSYSQWTGGFGSKKLQMETGEKVAAVMQSRMGSLGEERWKNWEGEEEVSSRRRMSRGKQKGGRHKNTGLARCCCSALLCAAAHLLGAHSPPRNLFPRLPSPSPLPSSPTPGNPSSWARRLFGCRAAVCFRSCLVAQSAADFRPSCLFPSARSVPCTPGPLPASDLGS